MSTLLIVTGHSKGLGKAITELFLSDPDCEVLGISRSTAAISNTRLTEVSLDLAETEILEKAFSRLLPRKEFDRAILINNAGWIGSLKPFHKLSSEEIMRVNAINFIAPSLLIREFLDTYEGFAKQKIICNISSGLAYRPESSLSGYCSSKASLAMLSEVLDKENHAHTRVFSLAPGVVDTEMQVDLRSASEEDFPKRKVFSDLKSSGKLSSPEEAAAKVKYLLDHPEKFEEVAQDVRKYDLD
ncbi:SDR family NAD(P)-dependent oxidoreductase [Algoriphagus namhaensis]